MGRAWAAFQLLSSPESHQIAPHTAHTVDLEWRMGKVWKTSKQLQYYYHPPLYSIAKPIHDFFEELIIILKVGHKQPSIHEIDS